MTWYIAFEGSIAAGKTTIAKLFAGASGANLVVEEFAENEFLSDFYSDNERWALPMQLNFLASRYRQFTSFTKLKSPVVSDHTYEKDLIFARLLLRNRELKLYENIHQMLKRPAIKPNLIVYLDAADDISYFPHPTR